MAAMPDVNIQDISTTQAAEYRSAEFYQKRAATNYADMTSLIGLNESAYYRNQGGRPPVRGGEKVSEEDSLRVKYVREAGFAAGVRACLIWRTNVTNKGLDLAARNLDSIYNFNALMIDSRVLPPVLSEMRDVSNNENDNVVMTNSRVYKINSPAKFASRAPHWRTYLYRTYDPASVLPDPSLLPRTSLEQTAWDAGVRDGCPRGILQAAEIFSQDLEILNRDFGGMVLYHRLADQNMISIPVVAEAKLPLNATGDSMAVDGTTLKLVAIPQFVNNREAWRPLVLEKTIVEQPTNSMRTAPLPVVVYDSRQAQQFGNLSPEAKAALRIAVQKQPIEAEKLPTPSVVMQSPEKITGATISGKNVGVQTEAPSSMALETEDEEEETPVSQPQTLTPKAEAKKEEPKKEEPKKDAQAPQAPAKQQYAKNPELSKVIEAQVNASMGNMVQNQISLIGARAAANGNLVPVPIPVVVQPQVAPAAQQQ